MNVRSTSSLLLVCAAVTLGSLAWSQGALDPTGNRSRDLSLALHRTGSAARCWNALLAQNPDAPSTQFRLRIAVDAQGHVGQVTVRDAVPQELVDCLRTQFRQASLSAGGAASVELTYSFQAGTPAPVAVPAQPRDASAPVDAAADAHAHGG